MGAYVCSTNRDLDVAEQTVKVLVLGFSGAGKTFIVYSWSLGVSNMVKTFPTDADMFNVERIQSPTVGVPMYMWDIGGKMNHRRRSYFLGSQGMVYVVDAAERRMQDVIADLKLLLSDRDLLGLPLLILVNKVTEDSTVTASQVEPALRQHVSLPERCAVCDIHLFSQPDLSHALTKLELLILGKQMTLISPPCENQASKEPKT